MASDGLMSYWKAMITLILQILSISGCESETEISTQKTINTVLRSISE
jgi:hypothetical protein